ncbi:YveK family protein [Listeria aquatica]|uniref:YveK family protein n=1 Tax=Listeria aquatica TaxID=1494960 RepID=UPI003EF5FB2C
MMGNKAIDLESVFFFIKKWFVLISVVTILGGVGGYMFTKHYIAPLYNSQSQIVIQQKNVGFTVSDVQSNIQLVNTYKMILTSPAVISKVHDELKLSENIKTVQKNVSVENTQDSQVLTINVLDKSPKQAKRMNDVILKQTSKQAKRTLGVSGVRVLTPPTENHVPAKPNKLLNTGIGMLIGIFLSSIFILFWSFAHQTIRNEEDVAKVLDSTYLGNVDHF